MDEGGPGAAEVPGRDLPTPPDGHILELQRWVRESDALMEREPGGRRRAYVPWAQLHGLQLTHELGVALERDLLTAESHERMINVANHFADGDSLGKAARAAQDRQRKAIARARAAGQNRGTRRKRQAQRPGQWQRMALTEKVAVINCVLDQTGGMLDAKSIQGVDWCKVGEEVAAEDSAFPARERSTYQRTVAVVSDWEDAELLVLFTDVARLCSMPKLKSRLASLPVRVPPDLELRPEYARQPSKFFENSENWFAIATGVAVLDKTHWTVIAKRLTEASKGRRKFTAKDACRRVGFAMSVRQSDDADAIKCALWDGPRAPQAWRSRYGKEEKYALMKFRMKAFLEHWLATLSHTQTPCDYLRASAIAEKQNVGGGEPDAARLDAKMHMWCEKYVEADRERLRVYKELMAVAFERGRNLFGHEGAAYTMTDELRGLDGPDALGALLCDPGNPYARRKDLAEKRVEKRLDKIFAAFLAWGYSPADRAWALLRGERT